MVFVKCFGQKQGDNKLPNTSVRYLIVFEAENDDIGTGNSYLWKIKAK